MIRPSTETGKAMKKLVYALAEYRDPLGPGVAIQRKGAVHDMYVELGRISFEVEDGRERGFEVDINVSPANENVKRAVQEGNVHEAIPKVGDIQLHHVCPEWASPCKHEIAALLELTKAIDTDHNVLLLWRGIDPAPSGHYPNMGELQTPAGPSESLSVDRTDRKKMIKSLRKQLPGQFVQFGDSSVSVDEETSIELAEFFAEHNEDLLTLSIPKIVETIHNPLQTQPMERDPESSVILGEAIETIIEYWLSR